MFACSAGPTYLGQTIIETPYAVDGGKTIKLPVTRAGAVPAENENYKIEGAGILASIHKGSAHESMLNWTFSFLSKKSDEISSVLVERVTDSGGLALIVHDQSPVLKQRNWIGRSAQVAMTKTTTPWLYASADSTFIFKFTIKSSDGGSIVMYQPSIISSRTKAMYLKILYGQ